MEMAKRLATYPFEKEVGNFAINESDTLPNDRLCGDLACRSPAELGEVTDPAATFSPFYDKFVRQRVKTQ